MPSVSKQQQLLMGQSYAVRLFLDGDKEKGLNPKDIDLKYRDQIIKIAKEMKKSDLEAFAKTSHKNLPEVKEKQLVKFQEYLNENSLNEHYPKNNKDKSNLLNEGTLNKKDLLPILNFLKTLDETPTFSKIAVGSLCKLLDELNEMDIDEIEELKTSYEASVGHSYNYLDYSEQLMYKAIHYFSK